jgi:hypothetical protein
MTRDESRVKCEGEKAARVPRGAGLKMEEPNLRPVGRNANLSTKIQQGACIYKTIQNEGRPRLVNESKDGIK